METGYATQVMEMVVTSTSLLIVDGDVVKTYTNPDVEFSDVSADENYQAVKKLIAGRKVFHLFVADTSTHVTVEARVYENKEFERQKRAEAIVVKTLGHRMLAQFYRNLRKYRYPVRIFDCEFKALEWFGSLR